MPTTQAQIEAMSDTAHVVRPIQMSEQTKHGQPSPQ